MGLQLGTQPPLSATRAFLLGARAMRLDSVMLIDHFQNVFPSVIWDKELTWLAAQRPTPHEFFDYQVLLGYLASRVGRLRLGVGVTEPIRRHPILIAQAMMTLSHLTKRAPILGIGAGERMNIDPYGLDPSEPVTRLEEALQIIRLCLSAQGPITFSGRHFRLERATMDLKPPPGKAPQICPTRSAPRCAASPATSRMPWVDFAKGQRKDDVMHEYLAGFTAERGGAVHRPRAGEDATCSAPRSAATPTASSYPWIVKTTAMVNQFYFYCVDEDFGPFFIKFCSYFPYNAKLCLNGHEWAKRQAAKAGIGFTALDNGFAAVDDPAALQAICDRLGRTRSTRCCASGWPACRTRSPPPTGPPATATSCRSCRPSSP